VSTAQVDFLERQIDSTNQTLSSLRSFILPGGRELAAHLHFARTVTRRAERLIAQLGMEEKINPEVLRYCNRLSDFLFVAARRANNNGKEDVLWIPGGNR